MCLKWLRLFFVAVCVLEAGEIVATILPSGFPRNSDAVGERAWLFRGCYNRQSELNFIEIGIGRMNSTYSNGGAGLSKFRQASAGFTFGADFGIGDTSSIIAPKMGVEIAFTVFGARVTYGQYLQRGNSTGVIGVEGGFCILSVAYAYVGYNFVKGNSEYPVIDEGLKLSLGINIPLWPNDIPPAKQPTHL